MNKMNTTKTITVLLCFLASVTGTAQFEQVTKVVSEDREGRAEYGTAVAINENFAIVGASRENIASGAAYVYAKDNEGEWSFMQKLAATDPNNGAEYGGGAAFVDDYVVVAAGRADVEGVIRAGALYVYEQNNNAWQLNAKLIASDYSSDAKMGMNPTSLAAENNTIVAGAPGENTWTGAVYIFTEEEGTWTETQKITAPNPQSPDAFGIGVALSGNQLAIGSDKANGLKGAVFMYTKNNEGIWEYDQTLVASDGVAEDYFGNSISILNDQMVIGAYGVNNELGKAYIFEKNSEGIWEEVQMVMSDPTTDRTQFGWSTDIQEDMIMVSAPHIYGNEVGEVFMYKKTASGIWVEDQRIQGVDTGVEDFYGWCVAMFEDHVIVGAPREDHDINGANEIGDAGAAYIFKDPTLLGGENNEALANQIRLYPNPTQNNLHIESQLNAITQLKVYTIGGVLLQEVNAVNRNNITLNTSSYSSGVYFMHVTLEDGSVHIQKIGKK
ncbi:adhesin [Marixanthomonas spongiae]|uniref:Adhesin n=1 Tax=Marixanthomonas spongiae TaxID=2174845 RepID=A0A2U0I622_9FLAO|nr:adhesin [Marixanthomonas spongiae]